jgi:hypothetical protein
MSWRKSQGRQAKKTTMRRKRLAIAQAAGHAPQFTPAGSVAVGGPRKAALVDAQGVPAIAEDGK